MQAQEIMTRDVISISITASVQDAVRRFAEYAISGMPVLDRQQRMVGIITEADVAARSGESVTDIMTRRVITATAETPVDQIAQLITCNHVKRIPIICGKNIIGIVSRADIVKTHTSQWACSVCGAIHLGAQPAECDVCGASGYRFEHASMRPEISPRA
jgi:CBS-domain-containing membrane protein